MKIRLRSFAIGLSIGFAIVTFVGCAAIAASHEVNPAVNFDRYTTFAWIDAQPVVDPSPSAGSQVATRIQQTARDLLIAKGYRYVESPEQADFVVGFGLGASDKQRIESYPAAYRGTWHWRLGPSHDMTPRPHTDGRLVVDIFDQRTHQPAWHGWGTQSLRVSDRKDPQPAIRNALTAILANFPPR